jgi:hypothetical protein
VPADPALVAETLLLVQAQAQAREDISAATSATVAAALRAFLADSGAGRGRAFYDAAAITRLAKQLAVTTRAGQRQTSTSAAAYWARLTRLLTGRQSPATRLVDGDTLANLRGVPLESVFGRLADNYRWLESSRGPATTPEQRLDAAVMGHWRKLARLADSPDRPDLGVVPDGADVTAAILDGIRGADLTAAELARRLDDLVAASPAPWTPPEPLTADEIEQRLLDRADTLVDTSLSLAYRAQLERSAGVDPRTITGYRRVIHPELGNVCGLCISASDRVYRKDVLLPLHPACKCTVVPIVGQRGGDGDPGSSINAADLNTIYASVGTTIGQRELSRAQWRLIDHGEIGPTLVHVGTLRAVERREASSSRSGRGSRSAVTKPSVDPATVAAVAERSIADLERRRDAGEDVAGPLAYQKSLLARMRERAAA